MRSTSNSYPALFNIPIINHSFIENLWKYIMLKTLDDLYLHMLKDMYHAEKQVAKLLPKIAKSVEDEEFKQVLQEERESLTQGVEALEAAFEALGKRPRAVACDAMLGLVEEASSVMEEAEGNAVDAGVLAAYQAIKHYQITRYGTLASWAGRLGIEEAASRFEEITQLCKDADVRLTEIAESQVNADADQEGGEGGNQGRKSGAKNTQGQNRQGQSAQQGGKGSQSGQLQDEEDDEQSGSKSGSKSGGNSGGNRNKAA
jgi:ferritin-like metal-binding protein YciE